jgi:hypothetical protein
MYKGVFFLLIGLNFFNSCKYPCGNSEIKTAFINFSSGELDTIVLKAYQPHDNYQHIVDTILIAINDGRSVYTISNDTTFIAVNDSNPLHNIFPGYDWQIYIPSIRKTVSISNITSENNEGGKKCRNPITSFNQEGQLIHPTYVNSHNVYTSGYIAHINY